MGDGSPSATWLEEFFQDILPHMRDLTELKLVLHVIELWRRSGFEPVAEDLLLSGAVTRSAVGEGSPEPGDQLVRRGLERAVANGFLLRMSLARPGRQRVFYLPSVRWNRDLLDRLRSDDPLAAEELALPPDAVISVYRPNVFTLYERHIGPLTPIVAEQLRDAERSYPRAWIEEAILRAVQSNKRSWRYIQAILARWEKTGPDFVAARSP